nr:MAG TPA: hypothetical protein [Caudoviricetes sp.]
MGAHALVPCCRTCEKYDTCESRCNNSIYKCGWARRLSQI